MTALAWMAPGCRAFMGRGILLSSRTLHNGRFLSAAVGSASFDYNDDPNDELENKLRQLTLLNGGKSLNPRSPRQVSNLLYGNNSFQPGAATSNDWTGPTDKATLQKIILRDNTASSNDDNGDVNQKQVAKLVLQCRELLASTTNGNPKEKMLSSESFASRASRGVKDGRTLNAMQVANFSNDASKSHNDVDIMNEVQKGSNGDVQEEEIVSLVDSNADTIVAKSVPASSSYPPSPYDQMVLDLFPNNDDNIDVGNGNQSGGDIAEPDSLDPYWMEPLLSLTKSSSRSLVRQLQATHCPMGYDPSASSIASLIPTNNTTKAAPPKRATGLLSYVRAQKSQYFSDAAVIVRVGDFYECYGIDAVLLVEHCGLNPMAGKARAGCPWKNVQATLDGLTNAGYRVAVYEEWNGHPDDCPRSASEDRKGISKAASKLKQRYLAQVVSSANPTYMHGLVLNDDSSAADDVPTPHNGDLSSSSPGRCYVGVIETNAGYTLVEISAEERTVVVSERLTSEAVSCRLVAYPPADPLFYVPPYSNEVGGSAGKTKLDRLPFLPWRQQQQTSASSLAAASHRFNSQGGTRMGKVRVKTLPSSLVVAPKPGLTDIERAKQTIVSAFLRLEDDSIMSRSSPTEDSTTASSSPLRKRERRVVSHDDFATVASSSATSTSDSDNDSKYNGPSIVSATNPLHLETSTQLGLLSDPAIPPLISSLLPDSAPASTRRFLKRWLLIPPPPEIADAMSQLVGTLKDGEDGRALPSVSAPPLTGKVISLIRAGQASAAVYREILSALDAASEVLLLDVGRDHGEGKHRESPGIVSPLLKILHHDTGTTSSDYRSLRASFIDAMEIIEGVVCTHNMDHSMFTNSNCKNDVEAKQEYISYFGDVVPPAFFERNEAIWRGRVKANALEHAHIVPLAAKRLSEAIAMDFWGVDAVNWLEDDDCNHGIIDLSDAKESKNPVLQDIFNNLIAIKSLPSWAAKEMIDESAELEKGAQEYANKKSSRYFHPRDRNGKTLSNRYTTERVQEAMSEYVEACGNARTEVEQVLTRLSWDLVDEGHLPAILQASHLNLILCTAAHHAASSNIKGWNTATIYDEDSDTAGNFQGVWPYWMDRSNSVSNTFDLDGLFLLTAPNMSGKSTLMRSTAAAAHLINSGLCAPVGRDSALRRFDSIFVRGASADVPTEDKSAFGAEMGDVAALLRSCGERSLIFVDEIGRGTSPKDGTSLAGAILEQMAESGMSGMFATHLHGMLELPFSSRAQDRLKKKRMAIINDESKEGSDQLRWTYVLEDGVCTNSLALLTAAKFGLPDSILRRAEELSDYWDADSSKHDVHKGACAGDFSLTNNGEPPVSNIQNVITILEETVGECTSIQIPPSYMSPPSLEGSSCVYILQVGDEERKMRYYVGETDRLSQRLSQHRSKGKEWSSLSAIAVSIDGGKSIARNFESLVIQRMAKSGFDLISVTDGTSVRSLGRTE